MQFLLWSTIESWSQVFGSKLTQSPANGLNLPHRASTDTYTVQGSSFLGLSTARDWTWGSWTFQPPELPAPENWT